MTGLAFLHSPRPTIPADRITAVLADVWGIEGVPRDVGGDRDQNIVITAADGNRWLVKIGQTDENPGVLDLQIRALEHIRQHAPDLAVPRVIRTRAGALTHALPAADDGEHVLRVFSYLEGTPLLDAPHPMRLLHGVGEQLACVDRALQGFFHPHAGHSLPGPPMLWDLREAPAIRELTGDIADADRRRVVETVLDAFNAEVLPRLAGLPAQVIHGDATAENILIGGDPPAMVGLIDFGDVLHAPRAQELAVAMADASWGHADPWHAACQLAAGYDEVLELTDEELTALYDLTCVRLATSATITTSRECNRAEGSGSMATLIEPLWDQFATLTELGPARANAQLRETLRLPAGSAITTAATANGEAARDEVAREALLARRRHCLMPGLELFYPDTPFHAQRGEGVWLIDEAGERHLDCYNNVPHVGHAHPHVNRAVARQTRTLNTHTRYLYASVLDYAEALAARMPGELGVALFVNSGSEAIDLAWRIARAYTGHSGALVTAHAYHGGTEASSALSPYDGQAEHVIGLPVPTDAHGGSPTASDPEQALARLAAAGHKPAAFVVDSTLSSDGILDPAPGYLAGVADSVRTHGGLCIADEVQSGFGRLGTWWGFEARGLTPDIVTLGKPMANGYPMGAVITTPGIMAPFADQTDYFSTFGGNPVACMAGLAVLDVIEREDLCAHAAHTGQYLREGLRALQSRHPMIGAVRGSGLFVGVEMVDPETGNALAATTARRIVHDLRQHRVLVGLEGPNRNVLKIRPPLAFRCEHINILLQNLTLVLDGVAQWRRT